MDFASKKGHLEISLWFSCESGKRTRVPVKTDKALDAVGNELMCFMTKQLKQTGEVVAKLD